MSSSKAWRIANPEKHRASVKKWQQANPDKVAARGRRYYKKNRVKILAKQKVWLQDPTTKVMKRMAAAEKYIALTPEQKALRKNVIQTWYALNAPTVANRYTRARRKKRHEASALLKAQNEAALYPA